MTIYRAAELALQTMGYFAVFNMVNRILLPKRSWWTLACMSIGMTLYTIFLQARVIGHPAEIILRIVSTVVGVFAPFLILFYQSKIRKTLFVGALYMAMSFLGAILITSLKSMVAGSADVNMDLADDWQHVFTTGAEIIAMLIIFPIALRFLERNRDSDRVSWMSFGLFLLAQFVLYFVCALMANFNPDLQLSQIYALGICAILCAAADVMLFWTIKRNIKAVRAESENATLLQMQAMQQTHTSELQEQLRQTSALRHDMANHLHSLSILFRQDTQAGLSYLQNLIDVQPDLSTALLCKNPALNAVLSAKATTARDLNIDLDLRMNLPERLSISDVDLVSVFCNLLDNAIEACGRLPEDAERQISLRAAIEAGHLTIHCENPCTTSLDYRDGLPATTKPQREGIGTRTVRHIARLYGGDAEFVDRNGLFTASVALPI